MSPGGTRSEGPDPTRADEAAEWMLRFAERTGLDSGRPPRRYLWTDAFAVCNFLGLARATGESRYADLALRLVEQVHHVLGRFRDDDERRGWISGLDAEEGERHPTRGGLRIGKKLPEREPDEPFDEHLEWDRDGQYFHYLTKWMHALDRVARATRRPRENRLARDLADAAHRAFVYGPPGRRRMVWKMSTDLSRPLVSSMGHHDPLDGFVTCMELEATASLFSSAPEEPSVREAAADFVSMIDPRGLATDDPLGLGGLLVDAQRIDALTREGAFAGGPLLDGLLEAALVGLGAYARLVDPRRPASRRLGFRELGLSIGIRAVERMREGVAREARTRESLDALAAFAPLAFEIESFWRDPAHRETSAWSEHRDINEVMLATSLLPDGFLVRPSHS